MTWIRPWDSANLGLCFSLFIFSHTGIFSHAKLQKYKSNLKNVLILMQTHGRIGAKGFGSATREFFLGRPEQQQGGALFLSLFPSYLDMSG